MTGHVIVIPTPIGHLGDLSLRTKETLARCDLVLCEDTRVCARLLEACGLKKPMLCYRDDNEQQQVSKIMDRLAQGACVGLTTDAGTPCISDPGYRIIHECRCRGVKVEGIPGPCAAILALSISGLPSHSFLFLGFPENRSAARLKLFTHYQSFDASLIFYESCHRIKKFLSDAITVFGADRVAFVGRELTKLHEENFVGPLSDVAAAVEKSSQKGEFVVIVAPQGYLWRPSSNEALL